MEALNHTANSVGDSELCQSWLEDGKGIDIAGPRESGASFRGSCRAQFLVTDSKQAATNPIPWPGSGIPVPDPSPDREGEGLIRPPSLPEEVSLV